MEIDMVPDVVILRLPTYIRILTELSDQNTTVVSSRELGILLQMTPAQIRKDLSYFGRFGKQGKGYNVKFLQHELRRILGLDKIWPACLVGVGRLGQAIINYPGFAPEGFEILAAFDGDSSQVGRTVGDLTVLPMSSLSITLKRRSILIGIVAVPSKHAQTVIDELVGAGITGVLNYAPISPQVPGGITLRNIDPVLSLQSMTFYLLRGHLSE